LFERGCNFFERGRSPLSPQFPSPAMKVFLSHSMALAGEGKRVRNLIPTRCKQNPSLHQWKKHLIADRIIVATPAIQRDTND
jgi:hypothetical protein